MKPHFPKIWLLGASFDTSNMGLSALAESTLKCIFTHWPQAEVILLSREDGVPLNLSFHDQEFKIKKKNLWFGRNVFRPQNAYKLLGYALILKLIPLSSLKNWFKARNPYFKDIMEVDLVVDITGGDSFSDLYGIRRLIFGTLLKWVFIIGGKKLIMLPQTYGPFNRFLSKVIARSLLARATAIYSRDQEGVKYVKQLLGKTAHDKPIPVVRSSKVFIGDRWKGMTEEEILKHWTLHEDWVKQEKDKNEVPMLDVRYEDIISHPQREMAKMFDFLEVEYDQALLKKARKITRSTIRLYPRLPCPPETRAIMSQYGYKTQSFLLEKPLYVNSVNFLKKMKRKITGTW